MNGVISIRIPEKTRSEMKEIGRQINWNEEIREFIKKRIENKKKDDVLASVTARLEKLPEVPQGSVAALVRADRDSH
jgi:hypothetical protein